MAKHDIHISVVSHGHTELVRSLLMDLSQLDCAGRIQLTVISNIPETLSSVLDECDFPIQYITNKTPKGFGANHNQAFIQPPRPNERKYFLVINPDVRLQGNVLSHLVHQLEKNKNIGVIAPQVINSQQQIEDSARPLPDFTRLFKKLFGQRDEWNLKGTKEMRKQVVPAIIVRQKMPYRRPDGTRIRFEDNAVVILKDDKGNPKGTTFKGAIAKEAAERWTGISKIAKIVV